MFIICYFNNVISTLRFLALPEAVELSAIGDESPLPSTN
jgi:hypothetical protein